jgi:hypothetical protein
MRGAGRGAAGVLAALVLAACDDVTGGNGGGGERPDEAGSSQVTGDLPAVQRIGLNMQATGAFRPGTPVVVTANAAARYGAATVDLDLLVLDDDPTGPRTAAEFRGAMGQGNQRQVTATLTFAQPGYYRVLAQSRSTPAPGSPQLTVGDTAIIEGTSRVLYLLVTETGGRLTSGYDPSAIPAGRVAMFGGFGPFVGTRGAPGLAAPASVAPVGPPSRAVSVLRGIFRYYNEDTRTYQPVPNAEVNVSCLDASFAVSSTQVVRTATDGAFSFTCPGSYFDANIQLRTPYALVMGPQRQIAGIAYFNESNGVSPVLNAENHYAAHVHGTLNRYVPLANSRFGVSRPQIPVLVHPTDSVFPIHYDQVNDTIKTNFKRVFGQDGIFVTVHEYGHAFQWRAVEPPADYYCNPSGQHIIDQQYTKSCAFVEGWATFFAAWLAGDQLDGRYGYSDYYIESQTYYSGGKDGMQVEGSVAGFFYDLVDASTAPDGYNNETGGDDTWDGVAYPGTFVASVLRNCTTTAGTTTYSTLLGMDEVVYCLEGNTTARASAAALGYTAWWAADSVNRGVTAPTGYSTDAVRRLWRRNFYGVS